LVLLFIVARYVCISEHTWCNVSCRYPINPTTTPDGRFISFPNRGHRWCMEEVRINSVKRYVRSNSAHALSCPLYMAVSMIQWKRWVQEDGGHERRKLLYLFTWMRSALQWPSREQLGMASSARASIKRPPFWPSIIYHYDYICPWPWAKSTGQHSTDTGSKSIGAYCCAPIDPQLSLADRKVA
jgi:hypothetical protein